MEYKFEIQRQLNFCPYGKLINISNNGLAKGVLLFYNDFHLCFSIFPQFNPKSKISWLRKA